MGTLILQSNMVIDTLAIGGWAAAQPSPLLTLSTVTAHSLVYQLRVIRCGTMITFAL